MVKAASIKLLLSSVFLLLLAGYGIYVSIAHYLDYFLMKEKIEFSFLTGLFGFGSPLIIYFAYFGFILSRDIKPTKRTVSTAKYLAGIAIFGMIFSLFFSAYVNVSLTSKGYLICDKKSIFAPNEYVLSKNMCK
ncbi:DUF1240 domain-containing protein [Morganella psychrotolerans]|nr:DUF1240 domain-containing protein [Morganella psychrotolerans]